MADLVSFEDALKAAGKGGRSVLLGNGFSMAQAGGQFAYATLLEKSGLADDSPIRNVFGVLKTFDFEKVMKALQDAAQVELAYKDHDRAKNFSQDAGAVRERRRRRQNPRGDARPDCSRPERDTRLH